MKQQPFKFGLVALTLLGGLLLAGCSSSPGAEETPRRTTPDDSDVLSEMIEMGLAESQSEFQTEVLTRAKSDGEISEADWKEANN